MHQNQNLKHQYGDLALISTLWLTLPTSLFFLGQLSPSFGFDVWPTGELRNWVYFLQYDIFEAPHQFWLLDSRNALSPWWYNLARPLFDATPAAGLVLQLLMSWFVGISMYLLLTKITYSRPFGLMAGILAAFFIPSPYFDGVIWNFVGALGCSLLSIYFFNVFCDDRRKTGYLSASYILWFVALSTYTFQIGAAPAIFLISLRETVKSSMRWTVAILRGLADVTSYIVLFAIYLMLWVTTTSNGLPRGAPLSPSLGAFIQSLTAGFWPKHYLWFWIWLTQATQLLTISIVLSLTVLFILLLARFDTEQRPSLRSLGFSLLIGLCVAAPTIFVEMSSDTWTPGTRWPMLYQFWTPLIVALVFFGVTTSLTGHWWHRIWVVGTASLAGFFMLLAFGVNYRQVTLTNEEKAFYGQFLNIVNEDRKNMAPFPRKYEVRLDSPGYFIPTQEFLRKSYAKTILGHDVYFRTINKIDRPNDGVLLIWKNNQLLRAPNPER